MSYDPSGYVVTDWDRAHLNDLELFRLEAYTYEWHHARNDTERDNAHTCACAVRAKYLEPEELILPDGHVLSDSYALKFVFRNPMYNIKYEIYPTVVRVDVTQPGVDKLIKTGMVDLLSQHILDNYKRLYGFRMYGRTVKGLTKELIFHYDVYNKFNGLPFTDKIVNSASIADMETFYYNGDHKNYWLFD